MTDETREQIKMDAINYSSRIGESHYSFQDGATHQHSISHIEGYHLAIYVAKQVYVDCLDNMFSNDLGHRAGVVVTIKSNQPNSMVGCAVIFDDERYQQWFHDSDEKDRRRYYMRDLKLVTTHSHDAGQ